MISRWRLSFNLKSTRVTPFQGVLVEQAQEIFYGLMFTRMASRFLFAAKFTAGIPIHLSTRLSHPPSAYYLRILRVGKSLDLFLLDGGRIIGKQEPVSSSI
jgi:hypothetical protein